MKIILRPRIEKYIFMEKGVVTLPAPFLDREEIESIMKIHVAPKIFASDN